MFDKDKTCPILNKPCIQHQCQWFIKLLGNNPQTGHPIDEFGCAVAWLPILLIENSQQSRQTGAAVESFRNEMVRQNEKLLQESQREHASDEVIPYVKG